MMARNKENAAKKKYHHHLGSGGYSVAMPKWEEMEASLIERGIEPATAKWPDQLKFWYYTHGETLNPVDGSLVFSDQIREAARRLTDAVEASSQGTFRQREGRAVTRPTDSRASRTNTRKRRDSVEDWIQGGHPHIQESDEEQERYRGQDCRS